MSRSPNTQPLEDFTVLTENTTDSGGGDVQLASYAEPDKIQVIAVGAMDLYSVPALRKMLIAQEKNYPRAATVEMDLSHVSFVDSTFFGVLIGSYKRLNPQRDRSDFSFKVHMTDRRIAKIFEIQGLDRTFEIEYTKINK
jgi:anti-anti-sigma factor